MDRAAGREEEGGGGYRLPRKSFKKRERKGTQVDRRGGEGEGNEAKIESSEIEVELEREREGEKMRRRRKGGLCSCHKACVHHRR